MNKIELESAVLSFLKAWEQKNIDAVVNLLSNSFEYYETPIDKPLTSPDQIRNLWSPVPKLKAHISLSFTTLNAEDDFGLFRIQGAYTYGNDSTKKATKIDRIFLIAIDTEGKITKFMQWRESKEILMYE